MKELNGNDWQSNFNRPLFARLVRLEEGGLTIEELAEEYHHTIAEMWTYFLCLESDEQAKVAPKLKLMLEEFLRREQKVAELIAKDRAA